MGFEDTLTNLYAHPDEMHALIDYITEYRLTYVRMLIDNLQPDVIFSHDDWGTKNALFMKPEMWREFFKEPYRRFYGSVQAASRSGACTVSRQRVISGQTARPSRVSGIGPGASSGNRIVVPQRSLLVVPRLRLPRRCRPWRRMACS